MMRGRARRRDRECSSVMASTGSYLCETEYAPARLFMRFNVRRSSGPCLAFKSAQGLLKKGNRLVEPLGVS